jgi:hypothetical protein
MGVSTQPVRGWIRLGRLQRNGPRHQISRAELKRFVYELMARAEPYDAGNYLDRIERNRKTPSWPWRKLASAKFKWPNEHKALSPSQLAGLTGCHSSLIRKAIRAERVYGYRRTRCRWAITKRAWRQAFFW